jgi:hypothetical protein
MIPMLRLWIFLNCSIGFAVMGAIRIAVMDQTDNGVRNLFWAFVFSIAFCVEIDRNSDKRRGGE